MSKFNIGDRVIIADPAYLVSVNDAHGRVSPTAFGKEGTVTQIREEDTGPLIGRAYVVKVGTLSQTISQRYLTAAPVEPPAPTLTDGVYRDTDGEVVLVREGKVLQVLHTDDWCEPAAHQSYWANPTPEDLNDLTRLVAVEPEAVPEIPLPADGFYSDRDGDLVQIKGSEQRYISVWGADPWEDAREAFNTYGPYVPLVEEDATK